MLSLKRTWRSFEVNARTLIEDFSHRGIRLLANPPKLSVVPASKLTDADREAIRAAKADLLAHLCGEQDRAEALALLKRLKTFTLPAGRMPAAREIAQRCGSRLVRWEDGEPVDEADDPAAILTVLRGIERELIALGGAPDAELAEAVAMVERTFPGARLVEVRKLQ